MKSGGTPGGNTIGQMDQITYLRPVDSGDISVIYSFTGLGLGHNTNSTYSNTLGAFRLDGFYNANQINLFLNGVAQLISGYGATGVICNSGISLSGDYAIIGTKVESTGFYTISDVVLYDKVSGLRVAITGFSHTGGPLQLITGNPSHQWMFNGQLILSGTTGEIQITGAHYYPRANAIEFISGTALYEGASGAIFSFPATGHIRTTGVFTSKTISPFSAGTSQVYLNGIRCKLGIDYIESSSLSLLSGSGIDNSNLQNLYSNNNAFWEF